MASIADSLSDFFSGRSKPTVRGEVTLDTRSILIISVSMLVISLTVTVVGTLIKSAIERKS